MSDDAWPLDELLRTLATAADRYVEAGDCYPTEAARVREAVGAARARVEAMARGEVACVIGGCTAVGGWRWPTLDGGTVPVCARHHDAAAGYVERKDYDDDEALWWARRGW